MAVKRDFYKILGFCYDCNNVNAYQVHDPFEKWCGECLSLFYIIKYVHLDPKTGIIRTGYPIHKNGVIMPGEVMLKC